MAVTILRSIPAKRVVTAFFIAFSVLTGTFLKATAATPQDSIQADSVMGNVFSYTERYGLRPGGFSSKVYVRHTLKTKRRNILMRYIPGMFRLERGENEYFGESLAHYQFRPPGEVDKKNIAAYSTMPYLRPTNDVRIGRYSISIYEPNLFTDRILSPLNRRNKRYYQYLSRYTYTSEGQRIASIAVRPRFPNTQLVTGTIDVDMASGKVKLFSFDFIYGWSRLHISGEMGDEGQASLMPEKVLMASHLEFLGNKVTESFEASAKYNTPALPEWMASPTRASSKKQDKTPEQQPESKYDLTHQCQLRIDTTSMRRDKAFFDETRPYPLMPRQQEIYRKAEEKNLLKTQAKNDTAALENRYRYIISPRTEDLLFDSHTFGIGSQSKVKLPPLLTPSMVQWSRSKGVSLQTRFALHHNMGQQQYLDFAPRIGYNFKQQQIYWRLPLTLGVFPHQNGIIRIEAAGGDHMYNSRQADEVRQKLQSAANEYDSLINVFDQYNFHFYRDSHVLATLTLQPIVGLKVGVGLRFHHRKLLNWNEVAAQSGMSDRLTSLAPRLQLSWTPGQYYYRDRALPVPLHSKWPTFMVDYERGLSIFNRSTSYERIEFDAKYTLPLYALRALYFRIGSGLYTLRGQDCFFDYDYFRNNYLPAGWKDELSGQFHLLDGRWYNESRHYVRASATYESPMMLFSRIRFLSRLVQKERIYANILHVNSLGYYSELGYGLSTPVIDLACFMAIAGHNQTGFGLKFGFRLFED